MSNKWMINKGNLESMPVPEGTLVDVVHRDGAEYHGEKAGEDTHVLLWRHTGHVGDIMRWRLSDGKPKKKISREKPDLRDYFAVKCIPTAFKIFEDGYTPDALTNESLAKCAYQLADAMLEARKQ